MKTISELNTKWWYRLIKIIYLTLIIVITVSYIGEFIVDSPENRPNKQINKNTSYITCTENNEKYFLLENNLQLEQFGLGSILKLESNDEAEKICAISVLGIERYNDVIDAHGNSSGLYERVKSMSEIRDIDSYKLTLVYTDVPRNWVVTVSQSFFCIILALLIAEIIRRTFYYVVLGKIKPEK